VIARLLADRRAANLAGFLACLGMMGYALYAERVLGFEPCPLCMFQRVGVVVLGAVFLLAALHHPKSLGGARAYACSQRRSRPMSPAAMSTSKVCRPVPCPPAARASTTWSRCSR
jgi:hypothetical protein